MRQPKEPNKDECCNSACNPCIFDVYERQKKLYELYLQDRKTPQPEALENAMSELEYTEFNVTGTHKLCAEHKLIIFQHNDSNCTKQVKWNPGQHFLLKYVSTTGQSCTRAYTPIKFEKKIMEPCKIIEPNEFAIILKHYEGGLVSNYLYNLTIGDRTLWRGPYGDFKIDSNFTRILMITQGTGISPFYSIIKNILSDEDNMTRLNLLYCCKNIETILLRNELYSFKSYWNFEYSIHISEQSQEPTIYKYQEPIFKKLSCEAILALAPFNENYLILICGSENFTKYYKTCLEKEQVQHIITF